MSVPCFIQNMEDGLVIDIKGAEDKPGTSLQIFEGKFVAQSFTPPTSEQINNAKNQLWTFPAGPFENSFFIQSQLGGNLVIDIKGGKNEPGAPLQVYSKKQIGTTAQNNAAKNQLWTWATVEAPHKPGTLYMTYFFIQSLLDSNLVIDIKGAKIEAGSPLQVFTKKRTGSAEEFNAAKNQLWLQTPIYIAPPK